MFFSPFRLSEKWLTTYQNFLAVNIPPNSQDNPTGIVSYKSRIKIQGQMWLSKMLPFLPVGAKPLLTLSGEPLWIPRAQRASAPGTLCNFQHSFRILLPPYLTKGSAKRTKKCLEAFIGSPRGDDPNHVILGAARLTMAKRVLHPPKAERWPSAEANASMKKYLTLNGDNSWKVIFTWNLS